MKKVDFLDRESVYFKCISNALTDKLDIFINSGKNIEFARKSIATGFILLNEDSISQEYLDSGRGVWYKGYIIFKADLIEESEQFKIFKEMYLSIEKEYKSFMNGTLYFYLKDKSKFSMLKSFIDLFEAGVFSIEWLSLKLNPYLKPEGANVIISQLNQSTEMAG